jgi:hypothetical protein
MTNKEYIGTTNEENKIFDYIASMANTKKGFTIYYYVDGVERTIFFDKSMCCHDGEHGTKNKIIKVIIIHGEK